MRRLARLVLALALLVPVGLASQSRKVPALSASRSLMAGAPLSVLVKDAPAGARLAIARPTDPASTALVVIELPPTNAASLPTPGEPGDYELRLTLPGAGLPAVLARQPLATTAPSATLAGPSKVKRSSSFPARGIGPNGGGDRVVLVPKDAPAEASGPSFFPAENTEASLEAPQQAGDYELRYVMHAPLAEHRILARQPVTVE